MALQFITGVSGAGKSYSVYHKIIQESIKNVNTQYFIVVPEQYTMQVQKQIMKMHPRHGSMNIDILSFPRLAHRVFEELQVEQKVILEDVGKSMILRKVVEEKKDQLNVFKRSMNKTGFIEEVKSLLSEFFQYRIGKETIEQIMKELDKSSMLYHKLQDMQVIYDGFSEYLNEYTVAEQVLEVLSERIQSSNLLKDSVICFDGFTGFTPIQYEVIRKLFHYTNHLLFTITIEKNEFVKCFYEEKEITDYELFALSKKTIVQLKNMAKEEREIIAEPYILEGIPYRLKDSEMLRWLESMIFRFPVKPYEKECHDIQLLEARNPREEAERIGKIISHLVRTGQCRFRDIGIIVGMDSEYESHIKNTMDKLDIPYFMDQNRSILNNPCMESIRSVLMMIASDFSYESVFRYLKAGMSNLAYEEIELLENYIIACGIRSYAWLNKPFERKLRHMEEEELENLNSIRTAFLEEIGELREELAQKENTVREMILALCKFMEKMEYEKRLITYEQYFKELGDLASVKTYEQIYENICEILNKMENILGNETMELEEFIHILDSGLEETKVGVIPAGLDQVLIGDMERSRFPEISHMFIVGMNDGYIPKQETGGGLLNERERELLLEKQVELAPTLKQSMMMELFYIYLNMTKPSKQLFLSYSKVDNNGKSISPSYLIGKIKQIFPNIQEETLSFEREFFTKEDSISYLTHGFEHFLQGEDVELWKQLFCKWKESDEGKEQLEKWISAAFYRNEASNLSKSVAKALYGEHLTGSATRLERYAACAFAHFLSFGLKVKEREEHTIRSMDIGTVFHRALELFSIKLDKTGENFRQIEDEKRDEMVEQCVNEAIEERHSHLFHSTKRNQYAITRMTRILKRTIWALQEHIKRGEFEPKDFELSFQNYPKLQSTNIALHDEQKIALQGKIDRIDTFEDEENVYVKIIDYKSGNTEFDVVDLYYGLQIQLVVYMNAALEVLKNRTKKTVIPAGIFYYNMKDPLIDRGEDDVERSILKQLKMNGLANCEEDIIEKLEKEDENGYLTIPVKRLSKGGFSKTSKIVTTEEFQAIGTYVTDKIATMGKEMMDGNVAIEPYQLGERVPCTYCAYKGICSFDKKLGNEYRKLVKEGKDSVLAKIQGKEEQ